jgi:hypothetical protein
VVKATDSRQTDNSRTRSGPRFHGATDRCIANRGVDSLRVVVVQFEHRLLSMTSEEDDDAMEEQHCETDQGAYGERDPAQYFGLERV